jgi:hypothetical protein
VLVAAAPLAASAQVVLPAPPLPETGGSTYTIFLRGLPIGSEQIAVNRSADGWRIVSSGRIGAPLDVVARRIQARYTPDWRPLEFSFDGTVRGQQQTVHTVVEGTAAKSDVSAGGQMAQKSDTIAADAPLKQFFDPMKRWSPVEDGSRRHGDRPAAPQIVFGASANRPTSRYRPPRTLATRRQKIVLLPSGAALRPAPVRREQLAGSTQHAKPRRRAKTSRR